MARYEDVIREINLREEVGLISEAKADNLRSLADEKYLYGNGMTSSEDNDFIERQNRNKKLNSLDMDGYHQSVREKIRAYKESR